MITLIFVITKSTWQSLWHTKWFHCNITCLYSSTEQSVDITYYRIGDETCLILLQTNYSYLKFTYIIYITYIITDITYYLYNVVATFWCRNNNNTIFKCVLRKKLKYYNQDICYIKTTSFVMWMNLFWSISTHRQQPTL